MCDIVSRFGNQAVRVESLVKKPSRYLRTVGEAGCDNGRISKSTRVSFSVSFITC